MRRVVKETGAGTLRPANTKGLFHFHLDFMPMIVPFVLSRYTTWRVAKKPLVVQCSEYLTSHWISRARASQATRLISNRKPRDPYAAEEWM
jgi:hypothetical protein